MEKKIADMGAPITIKERQTDRQIDHKEITRNINP